MIYLYVQYWIRCIYITFIFIFHFHSFIFIQEWQFQFIINTVPKLPFIIKIQFLNWHAMWELTLFLSNSYEACGGRFHKTWGEWLYWRWSKAFWLKNCIQIIFLSQNYSNNLSERTKKYVKVNIFPFWHKQTQSNIHPIVQRHAVIIQSCVRNPIHLYRCWSYN